MFNVGDIVRKINGTQEYKIIEILDNKKYKVELYPFTNNDLTLVFRETDLVLVS